MLGNTMTDLDGRRGVVRHLYRVDTVEVAILTAVVPAPQACPIWDTPVDLLARDGEEAAVPNFRQQSDELSDLEIRVLHGCASETDTTRCNALRERLVPYFEAGISLHSRLIAQVKPGDRVVDYLTNRQGTGLDPDPRPRFSVRHTMTVQLDEVHRCKTWPDGITDLSTVVLYPTLGLL
ncbi:hypothetical protein [Streptomyces sp. NPDC101455]|uniref:hypothetical protein n=1 Tax=Streptomyces sp. NPDC101455 TaxID=3366142 RepID=UPI0037FE1870